jgi:hypothetical protein
VHAQQIAIWEEVPSDFSDTSPIPIGSHRAWSVRNRTVAENICQSYEQVQDEILTFHHPDLILPQPGTTFVSGPAPSGSVSDLTKYDEGSFQEPVELAANDAGRPKSAASHQNVPESDDTPKTKYILPSAEVEAKIELPAIFRPSSASARGEREEPALPVPQKADLSANRTPATESKWEAPESWDVVKSQVEIRKILDSDSSVDDAIDERRESMFVGSHFQRFVRRMESAGPRIILERLKEEWDLPGDRTMSDELQLEKHLWALTALQLRSMDKFVRQSFAAVPVHPLPPITPKRRRKILELDGSIGTLKMSLIIPTVLTSQPGEIYQLSAIYPNSRIYHLTRSPRSSSIPLPSQAVQDEVSAGSPTDSLVSIPMSTAAGVLPLPYANASMHHIRSARLPTLLPASQLPALLAECYRVLKPGGVLELRLMDATPERRSTGPLLANWLEERLLLGLEQDFKCQRPVILVPKWARDAGFVPLVLKDDADKGNTSGEQQNGNLGLARCLRLPAAASDSSHNHRDVVGQVGVLVSRALWKDAWGANVSDDYNEHWWWENPEIVDECREWNTTWDVGTLFVTKEVTGCFS